MYRSQKKDIHLHNLLKTIHQQECQLELLRQLVSQEVQFTLEGSLAVLSVGSTRRGEVDAYCYGRCLEGMIEGELCVEVVESVLKYYSGGGLSIGGGGWKEMVLSRQDALLAKLVKEREQNPYQVPKYVMNYCRKILLQEYQLHRVIREVRKEVDLGRLLSEMGRGGFVQEDKLTQYCRNVLSEIKLQDGSEIILRYLRKGYPGDIHLDQPLRLLTGSNCTTISAYLLKKDKQYKQQSCSKTHNKQNPFVHPEIKRKLNRTYDRLIMGNKRQAQSIDRHILRSKARPTSAQIRQRINAYSRQLVLNLSHFYKAVRKIVRLGKKIEEAKERLLSEHEFNPKLLYNEIVSGSSSTAIIPSDIQTYLHSVSIDIPQHSLFYLFKRHADPITGKMTSKHFLNIFKTRTERTSRKHTTLRGDTRRAALQTILKQLLLQERIEVEKRRMMDRVDLRQVYGGLDQDRDGMVSWTDMRVVQYSLFGDGLSEQECGVLWWRMGLRDIRQLIGYEVFMYEMIPRVRQIKSTK